MSGQEGPGQEVGNVGDAKGGAGERVGFYIGSKVNSGSEGPFVHNLSTNEKPQKSENKNSSLQKPGFGLKRYEANTPEWLARRVRVDPEDRALAILKVWMPEKRAGEATRETIEEMKGMMEGG